MHPVLTGVLRRRARPLAIAAAASAGHQVCEALVPLAIGLAVDHAVDGGPPAAILLAVGGILVLFTLLAAGGGTNFWQLTSATTREAHELRVRAGGHVLDGTGTGRRAGDLAATLVSDARAAAEILRAVVHLISGAAGLLVTVAVLLSVDARLGLGMVCGVPAITLAVNRLSPWLERRIAARQHASGLAAAFAAELVHGLRPLRGFGGVPEAVRRFRRTSRTSRDAALRGASAAAAADGAGGLATGLVLAGTVAVAAALTASGRIGVGDLVTVVAMASFAGEPVERIMTGVKQAAISRASAARLAVLLDPGHDAAAPAVPPPGDVGAPGPDELLGVVATDPARADALAASFGAGRDVLVEPHAVHLLGRTLPEVLDTGRDTAPEDTARALAAARARDVGDALLDGGANLSGGQRQRVALARALAARPAVLVLQDPLTAVDAVTEDAAAAGLAALRRRDGGATVVISTSPALLARCDRVAFLAGARPAVVATHDELCADPGYAAAVLR